MNIRDKVMYLVSSALTFAALVIYLSLAPATAKAQCNGCEFGGNCWPTGTCNSCGGTRGELCVWTGYDYLWEYCGSCSLP